MTTKSAAAASGLQTDYYHHEDKPMEQDVCVLVCRIRQCFCALKNMCVNVHLICECNNTFLLICVYVNWTSAKDVMSVCLSPSVHVCICVWECVCVLVSLKFLLIPFTDAYNETNSDNKHVDSHQKHKLPLEPKMPLHRSALRVNVLNLFLAIQRHIFKSSIPQQDDTFCQCSHFFGLTPA